MTSPVARGFQIIVELTPAFEDPYYYVPFEAIKSGPAEISKEKEGRDGFWIGTMRSGGKSVEVTGFDEGPLKGLVKVGVQDIGTHLNSILFES